jgi:uncharacterized protein YbcC (UPF0753/DUF2309 family)
MLTDPSEDDSDSRHDRLTSVIDELAHLLPAQGPISIFIHHNTLHAFEDLPFEDAVEQAAERFGNQPFLAEDRYRAKLAAGRILDKDLEALVAEDLAASGADQIAGVVTRFDLWRRLVLYGVPPAHGRELSWLLEETAALSTFRTDLPADARATLDAAGVLDEPRVARQAVRQLWQAAVGAVGRAGALPAPSRTPHVRYRDRLVAAGGPDIDARMHPAFIRFVAAYLDQGLAYWSLPARDRGMHGCFLEMYGTSLAVWCGPWARTLPDLVRDDVRTGRTAVASLDHSLAALGVAPEAWREYLTATLLALRGWAGMVRQFEERPDRVPARELPATLAGYLAVRLLCERAAIAHAMEEIGFTGPIAGLHAFLEARVPPPAAPTAAERAWPVFHAAQLCGLDASMVGQWTAEEAARLEREIHACRQRQRRLLHRAYERALRHRFYDALVRHARRDPPPMPAFQAVFCLDEREESFRRHLEEVDPAVETFGTPGFFGVAMYHEGATDAHPRPLCPVAIRPAHFVAEVEEDRRALTERTRRVHRRAAGFLGYNVHLGSRMMVRGAVLMTAFGWITLVPLVLRVVFPWLASRWGRVRATSTRPARTRLQLDRQEGRPPMGEHAGFTVREMADIVRRVLEDAGLAHRLSPLVILLGHGSISLNNPHESAHDCGACGGGRGGPNARAFAQMANTPRVRTLLAAEGLMIPPTVWFVAAERNTCNNTVTFFDDDLVPEAARPAFAHAVEAIEGARRREAHERCRRFDNVPAWYPPLAAQAHVEGRAADLAQPRPEYGHATNAFCVIGRRARTRGLFLDRRASLTSYDPTRDADGAALARIMAAVLPVVAGISLEYYFSYVDPVGYGCGTKLPHNVTALLGVMDGAQSDLRTGLPWQMVEIHEATRLAIVVEANPTRVLAVLRDQSSIARLVRNRWVWLACLEPDGSTLWEFRDGGFVPHQPLHPLPVIVGDSATWYQGRRGYLAPVAIVPERATPGAAPEPSPGRAA